MTLIYFFPQPIQACRKVRKFKAASAAGLLEIELPHRLFSLSSLALPNQRQTG